MNTAQVLTAIQTFITDPTVLTVLAALIISGVPNALLIRIPVLGPMFKAALDAWAHQQLKRFAEENKIIGAEAKRIVEAKEQLIKNGTVDQATARATAQLELQGTFGLSGDRAGRFIESAVHQLPSNLPLLEAVTGCTFPTCGCNPTGKCEGAQA